MSDSFDIVSAEAIRDGRATDVYFERTETTLDHAGLNPTVVAEVTANQFPTGAFNLFAGVKDAAHLLEGLPVDVDALSEGQLFDAGPVLQISGNYRDFARYETALLGFLSHATGIATKALEARLAAPDTPVVSFGARHVHPSIAAMVERSALVAGFDGFSSVAAGDLLGREPSGTMPHALIICYGRGEQEAAWRAFYETTGQGVALCDTYSDEVEEVLRAAAELGDDLESVRIDTTRSRRGDFAHIVKEVRWELDIRGHDHVDIFVSGGLGPADLHELKDLVDGFGVGGYVSNANPLDFALDIVEVEGEPASKRGKLSGKKQVYRTRDGGHHVGLASRPGPTDGKPLLEPLIRDGELVREFDLSDAAKRAATDAKKSASARTRTSIP
ncbi:nicotinate phosphoribosyltransferase [Haladaptatus sp. GCM10025893]|uniref:nicotinate phosphoribosyltransferase n=1 Tax=Haladaptatus sp. GCM10025893 TaxID=3252659 RepID=UPI00360BBB25